MVNETMSKKSLPPKLTDDNDQLRIFVRIFSQSLEVVLKAFPLFGPLYQLINTSLGKRPKTTIIALLLFIGGVTSVYVIMIRENIHEQELLKQRNASYNGQMDELNKVEGSLKNLLSFVNQQKESLSESQTAIHRLKKEEQQLRPVVEADRKLVEAVLASRAQADSRAAWKERAMGFAIGLLSSFLASLIFEYVRRSRASRT
jgi:predicted PurR-regulated permease PerM